MKLNKSSKNSKKGFTLIELLVVIAIIATLGGLSYGPLMKHLRRADVMKSQNVCKQLTAAISTYESEYDSLPYPGSYPTTDKLIKTDDSDFLEVIMGINTDINDKGIKFFETDQAKGSKNGLVYENGNVVSLLDKWSNPYYLILDYDADGEIDAADLGQGSIYEELRAGEAIAATPGPDKQFDGVLDAISW